MCFNVFLAPYDAPYDATMRQGPIVIYKHLQMNPFDLKFTIAMVVLCQKSAFNFEYKL